MIAPDDHFARSRGAACRADRRGADHHRRVHQLRRLRTRVPQRGDLDGRDDLRDRSGALHRMRRPLRRAAVRAGLCPVDCIPLDPANVESKETLWGEVPAPAGRGHGQGLSPTRRRRDTYRAVSTRLRNAAVAPFGPPRRGSTRRCPRTHARSSPPGRNPSTHDTSSRPTSPSAPGRRSRRRRSCRPSFASSSAGPPSRPAAVPVEVGRQRRPVRRRLGAPLLGHRIADVTGLPSAQGVACIHCRSDRRCGAAAPPPDRQSAATTTQVDFTFRSPWPAAASCLRSAPPCRSSPSRPSAWVAAR